MRERAARRAGSRTFAGPQLLAPAIAVQWLSVLALARRSATTAGSSTRAATSSGTTAAAGCSGTDAADPLVGLRLVGAARTARLDRRAESRPGAARDRPVERPRARAGRAALHLRDRRSGSAAASSATGRRLWIVVPLIGIKYTDLGYHQRYTELTLPQSFGLTAMADFPSMVAVLVAVYFGAACSSTRSRTRRRARGRARRRRRDRDQAVERSSSRAGARLRVPPPLRRRRRVRRRPRARTRHAGPLEVPRARLPAAPSNADARAPARSRRERRNPGGRHQLRSLRPPQLVALQEQHSISCGSTSGACGSSSGSSSPG